jgi:hypothetical protein
MAAQISHIIAGEEALERATGRRIDLEVGPTAVLFRLGAQGPDIFYHNRRTMPSGLHYGALAHRRNFGTLVAGAARSMPTGDRTPGSPLGAYLLGLATHAPLDRAVHPFVIYFAGWADPSVPSTRNYRGCHPFLERLLDIGLLERKRALRARDFGLSALLGLGPGLGLQGDSSDYVGAEQSEGLVALWEAGLRSAYPRSTGSDPLLPARIANALADARHFYSATDPAATVKGGAREALLRSLGREEGRRLISIVYPESIPEGLDPMNEGGAEWRDPAGTAFGGAEGGAEGGGPTRKSYLDLVEEGIADAAEAISLVLEYWDGRIEAEELAEGIGEGSLSLGGAHGQAARPRICSPLPLSEAMDAEYASHVDLR